MKKKPKPKHKPVRIPTTYPKGLPEYIKDALEKEPDAKKLFIEMAPTHQTQYISWINDSALPETRKKRLDKMIQMLQIFARS